MKHKTAELEGAKLNAAVAKAEGLPVHPGPGRIVVASPINQRWAHEFDWAGSWEDGGPIIERERIATWDNGALHPPEDCTWTAGIQPEGDETANDLGIFALWMHVGPTPLIAAMRAYVASKLGEEVELP